MFSVNEIIDDVRENYELITGYKRMEFHYSDFENKSIRRKGEIILQKLTKYIRMKYFTIDYKIKEIKLSGRLKRALANVRWWSDDKKCIIKYNLQIFDEGLNEVIQTIAHELAHLQTEKSDGHYLFNKFCNERGIDLYHTTPLRKTYQPYCKDCNTHFKYRVKKSKSIKSIINEEGTRYCTKCGSYNLGIKISKN